MPFRWRGIFPCAVLRTGLASRILAGKLGRRCAF
jgi:hypothetical protein